MKVICILLYLLSTVLLAGCFNKASEEENSNGLISGHKPVENIFLSAPNPSSKLLLGQTLDIVINHPFNILVTGQPRLKLDIGGETKYAIYHSGNNSKSLLFKYQVTAGDNDNDGPEVDDFVDLNGGSLTFSYKGVAKTSSLNIEGLDISKVTIDTKIASIESLTPPQDLTYYIGDKLNFLIEFSEKIIVSGEPLLPIKIGSVTKNARYTSGSNSTKLNFEYIVSSEDLDISDGIDVVFPLTLNGSTIKDTSNISASLQKAPLINNYSSVLIDGKTPIITKVTPPGDALYTPGQFLEIAIEFSKIVNVSGTPVIPLIIGATQVNAVYLSGSGTNSLKFRYIVTTGLYDDDGILIQPLITLTSATIKDSDLRDAKLNFSALLTPNITVDGRLPKVTGLTLPADKIYKVDEELFFALNFNMNVNVSGSPILRMNINSDSNKTITYSSGSGTSNLIFRYVVSDGDLDLDGIELLSPLELNSGTIQNLHLTNADLNISSIIAASNTSGIKIDAAATQIVQLTPPQNSTYTSGENLDFKIKYNKNVLVTNIPRIALEIGGQTKYASYISGTATSELTFRYIAQVNDEDVDGIALIQSSIDLNSTATIKSQIDLDAELDFSSLIPNLSLVKISNVDPIVSAVTIPTSGHYKETQNLDFTLSTNVNIDVIGQPRLSLQIGASQRYATYLSGTGTKNLVFRYTISPSDQDNDGIDLSSSIDLNSGSLKSIINKDLNLTFSASSTSGIFVDTAGPVLLNITAPTAKTYIDNDKIVFLVNYSEPVIVTGQPIISLKIGTQTKPFAYESGSGSDVISFSYEVTTDEIDSDGITLESNLIDLLSTTTITDLAQNTASLQIDQTNPIPDLSTILVDAVHPKFINFSALPTDKLYRIGENIDFSILFDDIVTVNNTPRIQISTETGIIYADYLSGSNSNTIVFRHTVAPGTKDIDGITLLSPIDINATGSISDANGNPAVLVFPPPVTTNVHIDSVLPTISLNTPEIIKSSNVSAYSLSGSCSENTQVVTINIGSVTSTPTCIGNNFTTGPLNLSSLSDSLTIAVTVDHQSSNLVDAIQINQTIIKDTSAPIINSNSITSANIHGIGEKVIIDLIFNENIIVSGAPRIRLNFEQEASGPVYANYVSGTGTSTLKFEYIVAIGDEDSNGVNLDASVNFNSSILKDQYDNTAISYTLPTLNFPSKIIQGISTRISSVTLPANGTFGIGDHLDIILHYNQAVSITGTPRIQLTIGSELKYASYESGTGSQNIIFRYTIINGDSDLDGIIYAINVDLNGGTIKDSATADSSNIFGAQDTSLVHIDGLPATVSITSSPDINDLNKSNYTLSGSCSENGRDVIVKIGPTTLGPNPQCTSNIWTISSDVSSVLDNNNLSITANHDDQLGNSASEAVSTIKKDTAPPAVSSVSITDANYTTGDHIDVSVNFTEVVSAAGPVRIELQLASGNKFASLHSGSTTSTLVFRYTAAADDSDSDGIILGASINLNSGTIVDGSLNTSSLNLTSTNFPNAKILSAVSLTFSQAAQYNFGQVALGGSIDTTMIINHLGGSSATSVTETTLTAPFAFKGGSFPGLGGTCTTSINSNCSIVLSFSPMSAGVKSGSVTIQYNNGSSNVNITRSLSAEGISVTPTKITVSGPNAVITNDCIPFSINASTDSGTNANVTNNEIVNLVVNNGTGTFYSDNACSTSITSTTISSGNSSSAIYFRSTLANQSLTLVFNAATLINTTKPVTSSNEPVKIHANFSPEITVNECKSAQVNLLDASGIKTGSSTAKTINFSALSNSKIYSDIFCTGELTSLNFAQYEGTKNIYIKNSVTEVVTLNFTDSASSLTASSADVTFVNALTWWNNSFEKRMKIVLNNLDQTSVLSNTPILIKLDSSKVAYSDFQSNGEDIRFTLDDHSTPLDYQIDTWNTSGVSYVWIKVPTISASSEKNIYMYYKNSSAVSADNGASVWSSYQASWQMRKSGLNYVDESGGNNGSSVNVTDMTGPIGNAVSFNGTNSRLSLDSNIAGTLGVTSTLSFWIKTTQTGPNNDSYWTYPGIVGVAGNGYPTDLFYNIIEKDGKISAIAGNGNRVISNFVVNDDTWRYITVSRNSATGEVRFYINGVFNSTGSSATGNITGVAITNFGAITQESGGFTFFEGSLDGVRMSNSIQSDAVIKAEHKFQADTHITYGQVENL